MRRCRAKAILTWADLPRVQVCAWHNALMLLRPQRCNLHFSVLQWNKSYLQTKLALVFYCIHFLVENPKIRWIPLESLLFEVILQSSVSGVKNSMQSFTPLWLNKPIANWRMQFGLEGWWAWTLSSWSGSWPGNLPTRWVEMHQSQETRTQRSKTAMLRPRKWTNVPQKGTIAKGNSIFQPLIFRAVLVFKGVAMIHESMQQHVTIVEFNGQPPGNTMARHLPPPQWFPQIASSKNPKNHPPTLGASMYDI